MTNPLAALKLDAWYSCMLVLSAFVFVLSLVVEMRVADQAVVQLGALCGVFVGFGELVNHPHRESLIPSTPITDAVKITSRARRPTLLGWLFNVLGLVLAVAATVRAMA